MNLTLNRSLAERNGISTIIAVPNFNRTETISCLSMLECSGILKSISVPAPLLAQAPTDKQQGYVAMTPDLDAIDPSPLTL
jgi:hypothetical protein